MNAYHKKMLEHVYPFLEEEFVSEGGWLSEYLDYGETVVELVEMVRKRTSPGTSRLVQMACLFEAVPGAREIAHYRATPGWPVEYTLLRAKEEIDKDQAEAEGYEPYPGLPF